jgi:hypothetical protein
VTAALDPWRRRRRRRSRMADSFVPSGPLAEFGYMLGERSCARGRFRVESTGGGNARHGDGLISERLRGEAISDNQMMTFESF